MKVVNRLGGESKMTIEELDQTFNDQAVKSNFLVTGLSLSSEFYCICAFRQVISWFLTSDC
jgi:hypothetical protein